MKRKIVLIPIIVLTVLIILLIIFLNPSTRYNKMLIREAKWNEIISSKNENNNLVLTQVKFNDYNILIDENTDTLYYSLINSSKNKYNPSVSFETSSDNAKLVFFSDEITDEKIKSAYTFKAMLYNNSEYHIYNLKCTDLPVLSLEYYENDENKKYIQMEMYLFNNLANTTNRITISKGKLKVNDDSYMLSLQRMTPGKNMRDNRISILNMGPHNEYILTEVNNLEENEANVDEKNGQRVEVFINNEYKGMYLIKSIPEKDKKTSTID